MDLAHSFLLMDGLIMLIAGLVISYLPLDDLTVWVMPWALIISCYGFVLAFTIGAWKGIHRLTLEAMA